MRFFDPFVNAMICTAFFRENAPIVGTPTFWRPIDSLANEGSSERLRRSRRARFPLVHHQKGTGRKKMGDTD